MKNHLIENTLSLLGGAGLGAAVMYLFDPDLGEQRRHDAAETAGQAMSSTGGALHSTAYAAADTAKSLAGKISDYAHGLADNAAGGASSLSDRAANMASGAFGSARRAAQGAGGYASDMADRARGTRDDLADRAGSLWSSTRRSIAGEESHPLSTATGITAGTVGILALGAGLMYFCDPERGRGRRTWACDKVCSVSRRAGKRARSLGRHVGNQLHGVGAQASNMMPDGWTGDNSATKEPTPTATAPQSSGM